MCRNIRTLYNFEPSATEDEVRGAALQYVRKISGFTNDEGRPLGVGVQAQIGGVVTPSSVSISWALLLDPGHRETARENSL